MNFTWCGYKNYRVSIKSVSDYKHLLQENYVEYKRSTCWSVLMCSKNFLIWVTFWKKKYVCIPHSFLVINVCNQGKTLCSPCISAAIMTPCTISRVGGSWVSYSFDDEVTDSLETLENSPITTRLMAWEDASFIQPRVKASGSLLKLYSVVLFDVRNFLCLSVQIDGAALGFCFQACFPIVYAFHFIPMYRTLGMWVKSQPGSK